MEPNLQYIIYICCFPFSGGREESHMQRRKIKKGRLYCRKCCFQSSSFYLITPLVHISLMHHLLIIPVFHWDIINQKKGCWCSYFTLLHSNLVQTNFSFLRCSVDLLRHTHSFMTNILTLHIYCFGLYDKANSQSLPLSLNTLKIFMMVYHGCRRYNYLKRNFPQKRVKMYLPNNRK